MLCTFVYFPLLNVFGHLLTLPVVCTFSESSKLFSGLASKIGYQSSSASRRFDVSPDEYLKQNRISVYIQVRNPKHKARSITLNLKQTKPSVSSFVSKQKPSDRFHCSWTSYIVDAPAYFCHRGGSEFFRTTPGLLLAYPLPDACRLGCSLPYTAFPSAA